MPTFNESSSLRRVLLLMPLLAACAHGSADGPRTPVEADPEAAALASIRAEDIAAHVAVLASDAYEGRFPGSAGEVKTVSYLSSTLAQLGVAPAGEAGYLQVVPLASQRVDPASAIVARGAGGELQLGFAEDMILGAPGSEARVQVVSDELVFVGYGIVAPEYGWDDYAGLDV
ncbi:MAG: peptidase M28, partial [Myxococcales bacterium]|nr:peptidase M28 [Myxococcales bacterium]